MLYSKSYSLGRFLRCSAMSIAVIGLSACGGGSSPATDNLVSDTDTFNDTDTGVDTGAQTDTDTQSELVNGPMPTVTVRVSEDASVMTGESFDLAASIMLNTSLSELPVLEWQLVTSDVDAFIEQPDKTRTSAVINTEGVFELQFVAKIGDFEGMDSLMVTVTDPIVNQPPVVNAGYSRAIDFNKVLQLNGKVSDDGLASPSLATQWSFQSKDGNATFNELSDIKTQVTFDSPGKYTLTLEAFDGELTTSDSFTVTVRAPVVVKPDPVDTGSSASVSASKPWKNVNTVNGSKPQGRHEAGGVALNGDMYLMGGRGERKVNRYDPGQNKWTAEGSSVTDFSHFQPVVYQGKIYVVGGLTCCFPSESTLSHVEIFDPKTKKWTKGHRIPDNRRRGAGGAVVYKNKIYIVGGNTNGHDGGMVNWLDEYDPATNRWKTLKNAPQKRDHVYAAVVGDKLVVAGGRKTDHPHTWSNLVLQTDVYNFKTGNWENNHPNIPTPTAGAMVVAVANEAIVIGGEVASSAQALKNVQAYNVVTRKWRTLKPLNTGRHSGGAAVVGNAIHVASGNTTRGGGNEAQSLEKLELD